MITVIHRLIHSSLLTPEWNSKKITQEQIKLHKESIKYIYFLPDILHVIIVRGIPCTSNDDFT